MNKYLTKIAQISTMTLQKVHGDSSTPAPGTPGVEGVPVPKLPDLTKKAFDLHSQHSKDIRDTAVIGGLGGIASVGAAHLMDVPRIAARVGKMSAKGKMGVVAGIGTGLGLAADYAGLHINRGIDKAVGFNNTKETNVPL